MMSVSGFRQWAAYPHEEATPRLQTMLSEPDKLRERAKHCRNLAAGALDPAVEDTLLELANELEEEARRLDGTPKRDEPWP